MNCADKSQTSTSGLNESQAKDVANSLRANFLALGAKLAPKRLPPISNYMLAFCSVSYEGQSFVVVDGVYTFLGRRICDDDAGFAVVYDPTSRKFGELFFGVSSCAPK